MQVRMFCDGVRVLCLVHLLVTMTMVSTEPISSDFKRHTLVQPRVQHGRTKLDISTTRDTSGGHHPEVTMRLPIDGEEVILDLRLNQDLLSDNHVLTYQEKGETIVHKPKREEIDLCHYGGTVRDKPSSWVALSTCDGVQGVVFDGKNMRYIEPAQGGDITSQHYIYDHSDLSVSNKSDHDASQKNNPRYNPQYYLKLHNVKNLQQNRLFRYKRQAYDPVIHAPNNANSQTRYVELVLVADYSLYVLHKRDVYAVYQYMQTITNIVNHVYSSLNIVVALVNVEIWNKNDKISINKNPQETLDKFLKYRRTELLQRMPNDNAHLITARKFDNGVLGIAYKKVICSWGYSGGVSSRHTSIMGLQAITIAHELGHNFGMKHDEEHEHCDCPGPKCIMESTSTDTVPTHWSTCSLNKLGWSYQRGLDLCLRNKPKRLFNNPYGNFKCGNGFVDEGEQCDCGTTSDPRERNACHACCDPNTCMLRANATCGAGECCDLQTCSLKSAGTMCRSADRECDLPEYCTGHSGFCPEDLLKMDTTPCGKEEKRAYCVRGSCRSHTDQCRLLWGTTGKEGNDKCYLVNNIKGNKDGHCGYDRLRNLYKPCNEADSKCGKLQCSRLGNEEPYLGAPRTSQSRLVYIPQGNQIVTCNSASIDLGLETEDPGLVPDGARCGDQKMCWSQQCLPVAYVRTMITNGKPSVCLSNCSGHGVCNSKGECHCDPGYAPPLCTKPGPGGSISSGPISDKRSGSFMLAIYVIFGGLVPLILLILILIYCCRPKIFKQCKNCSRKTVTHNESARLDNSENCLDAPDIRHSLLNESVGELNNNPDKQKINSGNKNNSVMYSNMDILSGQNAIVNSRCNNNLNKLPNTHYANFKISNIQKPDNNVKSEYDNIDNLKHANSATDHLRKAPVNIGKSSNYNVDAIPSKGSNTSIDNYLYDTPVNVVNFPGNHLQNDATGNLNNSSNGNSRKSPGNNINFACNSLSKTSTNVANLSSKDLDKSIVPLPRDNLRKTEKNVDQCRNDFVGQSNDNASESIVNVFNVKLRKTPINGKSLK